jgi:hypothetical protein
MLVAVAVILASLCLQLTVNYWFGRLAMAAFLHLAKGRVAALVYLLGFGVGVVMMVFSAVTSLGFVLLILDSVKLFAAWLQLVTAMAFWGGGGWTVSVGASRRLSQDSKYGDGK